MRVGIGRGSRPLTAAPRLAAVALAGLAAWAGTSSAGVAATGVASGGRSGTGQHGSPPGAATKTVRYGGYTVRVPAAWPVLDLTANPTRCVRFDRHAVYLGRPGSGQRCPAAALGRTEALLVEPLDRASAGEAAAATGGTSAAESGTWSFAVPRAGVLVTAAYGDSAALRTLTGIAVPTPAAAGTPAAAVLPTSAATAVPILHRFTGEGFDACTAPSASAMNAWKASRYRSLGVYVGGINRACPDGNLSASWVRTVTAANWRLFPLYVGRQASCNYQGGMAVISGAHAAGQAQAAARDAAGRMHHFHMGAGNPVYLDMEAYDSSKTGCRQAVLTYVDAWTRQLHALGYVSGLYSSAASAIADVAKHYHDAGYARPDVVDIANWNGRHSVYGDPFVPDPYWNQHRRIHQYSGGHDETYGGVTINIDGDYVDSAVYAR